MNVYVSVDIEGISGVVHADMMMPGQPEYARGRALMMNDANAAIEGAVDAGATHVLVADGHGPMRNLRIEDLHPAASLVTGTGDAREACQLEGADTRPFDAALFIGYHAKAQTLFAIHPHTIAGVAVRELRVEGRAVGETGLNAMVLASLGIPTVLVTGDETTCAEARTELGVGVRTVAVKVATGRNAAICRHPASTTAEIRQAAAAALGDLLPVPDRGPGPVAMEVDLQTMPQAARAGRTVGVEAIGPMTLAVHGDTLWAQYRALWAALRSAMYQPESWLA